MGLIFVYGTLKRGGENHRFLEHQTWAGEARTEPEYRLYLLDGYPGLVPASGSEGQPVEGEVWEVDAEALQRIDVLEGTKIGLYRRGPVRLQAPFGGQSVESYFYLRSVEGRPDAGVRYTDNPPGDAHDPIDVHPRPHSAGQQIGRGPVRILKAAGDAPLPDQDDFIEATD